MKQFKYLVIALVAMAFMSCSFQVPSGHVGILYNKYGAAAGVEDVAYEPGVVSYNPSTQEYKLYPTFQTLVRFQDDSSTEHYEGISYSAKDGNEVKQEIGITAYTDKTHAPILFQKYREDFETILATQVKQRTRDYFNQFAADYGIEDIYGEKRSELLSKVEKALKDEFNPKGVLIDNVSYLSKPQFSPQVNSAIEGKIVTQQETLKAQLAVEKAKADADAAIARARGTAESNRIVAASLSPQILESMQLENQRLFIDALDKGKATMPSTYVTSASNTFLPIK